MPSWYGRASTPDTWSRILTCAICEQVHPWFRKDWPLLDLDQVNAVRAVMARSK